MKGVSLGGRVLVFSSKFYSESQLSGELKVVTGQVKELNIEFVIAFLVGRLLSKTNFI